MGIQTGVPQKLKKDQVYRIEWIDTFSYNGWFSESQIDEKTEKNSPCNFTVGYFIKETKDFIILCRSREFNPEFSPHESPIWIPKGTIKKIRKIPLP